MEGDEDDHVQVEAGGRMLFPSNEVSTARFPDSLKSSQIFSKIRKNSQRFSKVRKDSRKFSKILKVSRKFRKILENSERFSKILKDSRIFRNFSDPGGVYKAEMGPVSPSALARECGEGVCVRERPVDPGITS